MSKRVLLLLMAALTCMFIFAGCGGDDGDDADPAVTDALQAQIEALEAQLAANEITLAEYQAAIDALESDAEGRTYSESCTLCHESGSVNDPGVTHAGLYTTGDFETVEAPVNHWSGDIVSVTAIADDAYTIRISFATTNSNTFDENNDSVRLYFTKLNTTTGIWERVYEQRNDLGIVAVGGGLYDITTYTTTSATAADPGGDNAFEAYEFPANIAAEGGDMLLAVMVSDSTDAQDVVEDGFNVVYNYNASGGGLGVAATDATIDKSLVSQAACDTCHGDNEFGFHHDHFYRADVIDCVTCHIGRADNDKGIPAYNSNGYSTFVNIGHTIHTEGYPNNLADCTVCHAEPAQYTAVTDESEFIYDLCISCHGDWDSVVDSMDDEWQSLHSPATTATSCTDSCHTTAGLGEAVTLASIHENSAYMVDKEWGEKVEYRILSASVADGVASVTWQAVDPTNADTAWDVLNDEMNGEPAFLSDLSFSLDHGPSFDVAFFTGDDITNQGATTRDGQPDVGASFTTENTVAGDVAGTYVTTFEIPSTVTATKAYFNIQGQPNIFEDEDTSHHAVSASAVYAFNVADGSAATARRVTADMDKCLDCHGTLSLHGGNRINSVETCVICHNPNATDITGRNSYGDDVDKTLGGEQASYDFSVMIHGIHAATATDTPYYVYRSRGIYGFRGESDLPETFGVGDASWNDVEVRYPRSIGSCDACHTSADVMADQAEAIAVTIDQGADLTTHDDDTIIGPNSAACSSCHKGNITGTADMAAHLQSFGYSTNAVTKDEVLEAAE